MSKCCNSPSLTFVLLLLYAVPLGLAGEISMIWFKFLITVKAVWSGWVSTKCRVQTFGHAPDQSSDIWDEWFHPAARTDNSLSLHPSVLGGARGARVVGVKLSARMDRRSRHVWSSTAFSRGSESLPQAESELTCSSKICIWKCAFPNGPFSMQTDFGILLNWFCIFLILYC